MIRNDLATARGQWLLAAQDASERERREQSDLLAYYDAAGRVADFHALRHSYISRIVQSGASAKTAQTLARHSTVQLTLGRYAHASLLDLASAVESLPPILPAGPQAERQALRATGTDGKAGENAPKNLSPNLSPSGAISGDFLRQTETDDPKLSPTENPGKPRLFSVFQGSEQQPSKVEAAGIEPASRDSLVRASTCIAASFEFARRAPTGRVLPTASLTWCLAETSSDD